jgi:ribosomal protein L37AE/L43A
LGMQRSYDCPECDKVAFMVVKRPDILRCLSCGCDWQFAPPPPEAERDDLDAEVRTFTSRK